jgi:hypothetical protein
MLASQPGQPEGEHTMSEWYSRSARRHLLDFHIPDWHQEFLSRFDPEGFADCVVAEHATAATFFANTHTGLCNYPTRVGRIHGNLHGRDLLGETIAALHKRGIAAIVYYCLIYTDWYWETHPQSRVVDALGRSEKQLMPGSIRRRRFSTVCPNSQQYRDFVVAQLEEICSGYEFEGVYPDMTFWPAVCYCRSCRERYEAETGHTIPRVVDWEDPEWVGFQRKREQWMTEFADLVTFTIRKLKPAATVSHQSHTFFGDWRLGASVELSRAMDWLCADLYGERYGLSFYAKTFYSLSDKKPFEHINTWTYPSFLEHVVPRTEDHLRMSAFSSFMNNGAMVFIDAVDPRGTIRQCNYPVAGRVFEELSRYEQYSGGAFCQDVGIYLSYESCFDPGESGTPVAEYGHNFEPGRKAIGENPHRIGAVALARTLLRNHIPYGVVTRKNLASLNDYQILVLPHVAVLAGAEVEALRTYVREGGAIYASKNTAILDAEGHRQQDFLLTELFGVSYVGETKEIVTYAAPTAEGKRLFGYFTAELPLTVRDSQLLVRALPGSEVLATVTLPYVDPRGSQFASMLTDPPGIPTEYPAVVFNRYGDGRAVYATGTLERGEHETQAAVMVNLLKLLSSGPFQVEIDGHSSVESTLFRQEDKRRFILHLLNYQQDLPNIPLRGVDVRVRVGDRRIAAVYVLPGEEAVPFAQDKETVAFSLPVLENYAMLELRYGP